MAYSAEMMFGKKIPLAKGVGTTYSDVIKVKSTSNYHGIFFDSRIVKTCLGAGASLQIKLQESKDGITFVDVMDSGVVPVTQLTAGKEMLKKECPQKQLPFYRLAYIVTGASLTDGELFASFCDAIDMR